MNSGLLPQPAVELIARQRTPQVADWENDYPYQITVNQKAPPSRIDDLLLRAGGVETPLSSNRVLDDLRIKSSKEKPGHCLPGLFLT